MERKIGKLSKFIYSMGYLFILQFRLKSYGDLPMNYILVLQTLVASIKAVEQLMPDSPGKDKFDAAITLVESVAGSVQSVLPALHAIATLVVNALRVAGVFAKKAAA